MVNATSPHTQSKLLDRNGKNSTRTAVSTNIVIQVDGNPVGAIATLSIDESRQIQQIDEVGSDGHIDSVPKSSTNITGSCKRTRFDNLRIAAAFSRGFVHVSAQRRPFDIQILDIFAAEEDSNNADNTFTGHVINTIISNVWINKISVSYSSDNFVIVEDMGWEAEHIYSYLEDSGSSSSASSVYGRTLSGILTDVFETQADIGQRRGALDAAGLLQASETLK